MGNTVSNNIYILVRTDGYSITTVGRYTSRTGAKNAISEQYDDIAKGLDPITDRDWLKMSHKNDDSAILYDRGDNVFVWQIIKV